MLIKFDFSSKIGVLAVKFAFAIAILKIETLRMRRRFARVLYGLRGLYCANQVVLMLTSLHLHEKSREVCIKARSPPTSLALMHSRPGN